MKPFGLILCGGKSTRMGQDKSLLNYHGKPQRQHLTDLLLPFCEQVFWSVNQVQFTDIERFGGNTAQLLVDKYANHGPLGGVLTAIETHQNVAWLVVSCDLPLLSASTIQCLFEGRFAGNQATAFADTRPYPFVSIWESAIFNNIRAYWARGGRSPMELLQSVNTHFLTMPNPNEFLDVNDNETYQLISKT